MTSRNAWRAGLATALALATTISFVSAASAKPKVRLAFAPQGADAGSPIPFVYTASGLPSSVTKIVVQRQVGTALKYHSQVKVANVQQGTGTLKPLSVGEYQMRIAALGRKRKGTYPVVAQKQVKLRVYATSTFSVLFDEEEQTQPTPTNTFSYTFGSFGNTTPSSIFSVKSENNTCRFVHVDWVTNRASDVKTATVSLLTESADAISASASPQQISAVEGPVVPGESWGINIGTDQNSVYFFVNGTASCYTPTVSRY